MSSSNIRIYQITDRVNPAISMEIRGIAVKETEFVVSNIIFSKAWKEAGYGESDRRTQFPKLIEKQYSEAALLAHFQPLLLNDVNVFDGAKGTFLNVAVAPVVIP